MKNLGKLIIYFLLFTTTLGAAGIDANVDFQDIVRGQRVTYTLKVEGQKVKKPNIQNLCNSKILSTASQTNIEMIHGGFSKSYLFEYTFMPKESCTIDPISVEVDGKKYFSKPIKISVNKASSSKNSNFSLELHTKKKVVYVGEPFDIELVLKQKKGAQAVDSKFTPPTFKGFWLKNESKPLVTKEKDYIVTKVLYTLSAQREGKLVIDGAQMAIATRSGSRDIWGSFVPQVQWRSYYSNELEIEVKPLPTNQTIVGDFTISAVVDKTKVLQNEAVNLTLEVQGRGNLEDIPSFKPYIPNVNVFDEKIQIDKDHLTQKIVFVADSNFTIPPFSLQFFNLKTQKIQKIQTNPIKIEVIGGVAKQHLEVKKASNTPQKEIVSSSMDHPTSPSMVERGILFFVGMLFGGAVVWFFPQLKRERKKDTFNIKDEKKVFMKLLPYKDEEDVQEILKIIEENLYMGKNRKLDKKKVQEILKRYDIS